MKKHLLLSILIGLTVSTFAVARLQTGPAANVNSTLSASTVLQPTETQADFDLMRQALEEANVKTLNPSFKEHSDWPGRESQEREEMAPNPVGGFLVTSKRHSGVAEQPPGKHPFLGKVLVLIDGLTFSTAADFCAVAHHLKRATFIGEETGGSFTGTVRACRLF